MKYDRKHEQLVRILYVLTIILFITVGVLSLILGYNDTAKVSVKYVGNPKVEYKVYLKDNAFYDKKYISWDDPIYKTYITSLIDYVDIDFSYALAFSEPVTGSYTYYVLATIEANQNDTSNSVWTRDVKLTEPKTVEINDKKQFVVMQNVKVDYETYNNLLNEYKNGPGKGLKLDGLLKVTLVIDSNTVNQSFMNIIEDSSSSSSDRDEASVKTSAKTTLQLPLSELAIETKINTDNSTQEKEESKTIKLSDIKYLIYKIAGVFSLGIGCIAMCGFANYIKKNEERFIYELTLGRILNSYDSIIVNTKTLPDLSNHNVITVNSFEELLDAHSELRMPINFYENPDKKASVFFLLNEGNAWKYVLKEKNLKTNK